MITKFTKQQGDIIKTALLRARNEAILHLNSLPEHQQTAKRITQDDINAFNNVLSDLFNE